MSSIPHQHGPIFDGQGMREGVVRWVKMLGAAVWGLSLGVIGLWIFVEPGLPGFLGRLTVLERGLIGMGMLAGGQLVFLICVAERVFVFVPRRLSLMAHWVLFMVGAVSFVLVVGARLF